MKLFNKKDKMTIEKYSYYVLGIICCGAGNFFERNKDIIKFDLYSEIAYYTFFTYISEIIMLKKYSANIVEQVKELIIKRMIEVQYKDCSPKDENTIEILQNIYADYYNILKLKSYDFNKEEDLYDISKLFLQILELPTDIIYIMNICFEFSGFVKFHTKNILNDKIKIIEN